MRLLQQRKRKRAKRTEETGMIDVPTRRATRFDDTVTDLVAVINDLLPRMRRYGQVRSHSEVQPDRGQP